MKNMIGRKERKELERMNKTRPKKLTEVSKSLWPPDGIIARTNVWMNQDWLVQEFREGDVIRLSVNRTCLLPNGRWNDQITWDELQFIKSEVGYGDRYAVEVYPKDDDVVNVANMRHLWIPAEPLQIGWRK